MFLFACIVVEAFVEGFDEGREVRSNRGAETAEVEAVLAKLHFLRFIQATASILEDTQRKWNPIPPIPDSRIPAYASPLPEAADIQLAQTLVTDAALPAHVAAAVVAHARAGHVTYDANALVHRIDDLRALLPKFPGLDLHAALSREPAVLNHRSTAMAFQRHLTQFQDAYPQADVGALLPAVGRYIIRNPRGLAEKLKLLDAAFPAQLGRPFPLPRLSSACTFLSMKPQAVSEHLSAFVSIFGAEGAASILVDGEIATFKDCPLAAAPLPTQATPSPPDSTDPTPPHTDSHSPLTAASEAGSAVGGGGASAAAAKAAAASKAGGAVAVRVNESIVSGFVTQLVAAHPVAVLSLSATADAFASRRQWLQFVTGLDAEGLKRAVLLHPLLLGVHDYEIDERSKALAEAHGFASVQEGVELFATRPELLLQPLATTETSLA
ncbi:MAG: hypothetical protein WDW38_001232 [Sanguina aurantia]